MEIDHWEYQAEYAWLGRALFAAITARDYAAYRQLLPRRRALESHWLQQNIADPTRRRYLELSFDRQHLAELGAEQLTADEARAFGSVCQELQNIEALEWEEFTRLFPALAPYPTVYTALEHTAALLGYTLPPTVVHLPMSQPLSISHRTMEGRIDFGIADNQRVVRISPERASRRYQLYLYEYRDPPMESDGNAVVYAGATPSLEEAAAALGEWYVCRCVGATLHARFAWLPAEPSLHADWW